MSSVSTFFDAIKQSIETDWQDLENILTGPGGSGFTQANFAKLLADFENGALTDAQQFLILVQAVAQWGLQVAPVAQKVIDDAALVAAVQPAVEPIVGAMQATLTATEALDQILVGANTTPQNLSSAIATLTTLGQQTGNWFTDAVAAIKAATKPAT